MDSLLLVFCKNPVLGQVKTRLGQQIGMERALIVYKNLLQHTAVCVQNSELAVGVCYSPEIPPEDAFTPWATYREAQGTGDLGQRMSRAFAYAFEQGYGPVVIIGSDLWALESNDLTCAFQALKNHEFVLGPAMDGGYYLLGMRHYRPEVFENIPWSTAGVFQKTVAAIGKHSVFLLDKKNDIDTWEDLKQHPELLHNINYKKESTIADARKN